MKTLLCLILLTVAHVAMAQVAINNDASQPDPSAMLDIKSTTRGLLAPRMTMAQRNAIISPATGLIIYQTDNTPGYYYNAGSPAAPSWIRHGALSLPYTGTASTPAEAFIVYNTMGTGLRGISMNSQGIYRGVYGTSASTSGRGVEGYASSIDGAGYGVMGRSVSPYGHGVWGEAMIDTGFGTGVFGISHADSGTGVYAYAYANSGENYGVRAFTNSAQGYSGYFVGPRFYVSSRMGIGAREPSAALEIYTGSNHLVLNDANGSSDRPGIQFKNNDSHYISGDDSTNELFGFYSSFSHTRAHDARLAVFGRSNTWWGNNISLTHTGSYGMIETDSGDIAIMPHQGKVGIGTIAPTQRLDIDGQIRIRGGSPAAGSVLTSDPFGVATWLAPSFVKQGGTISAYSISDNFVVGSTTMDNNSGTVSDDKRLFFNKTKGAFRAGYVLSTEWDDVLLGPQSAAFGFGTEASGSQSFAVGYGTKATGMFSMAFAGNTISSGTASTSFGNGTMALGNFSMTTGLKTIAAARSCLAIGEYNLGTGNGVGWVLTDPIFEIGIGTDFDARANAVTVLKNGNVGIGNASPGYKLDVAGNRIRLTDGSEWIALRTDGSPGYLDLSFAGGDMVIQGSATDENVIINPSMNRVGVRTWAPQYELDVNGSIRATGSVYYGGATSGAGTPYNKPDFVFDESYQVWSTEEVADFLHREKHLPWLTSAKQEQKENGAAVNMTRMSFESLEAIENLQLQLVEMHRQIKMLQLEIMQLKSMSQPAPKK